MAPQCSSKSCPEGTSCPKRTLRSRKAGGINTHQPRPTIDNHARSHRPSAPANVLQYVTEHCFVKLPPHKRGIIHLIYRAKSYEGHSKDYEFSRLSMQEHWRAGYHDARRTLRHREVLERSTNHEGVLTFDLAADGRE